MKFEQISETAFFDFDKNTVITVEYNELKINGQTVKTFSSQQEAVKDLNKRVAMLNAIERVNRQQSRFY